MRKSLANVSASRLRGLRDIKTHFGKARPGADPHRTYLRVSELEAERKRKEMAREVAQNTIETIDARQNEIEEYQVAIDLDSHGKAVVAGRRVELEQMIEALHAKLTPEELRRGRRNGARGTRRPPKHKRGRNRRERENAPPK